MTSAPAEGDRNNCTTVVTSSPSIELLRTPQYAPVEVWCEAVNSQTQDTDYAGCPELPESLCRSSLITVECEHQNLTRWLLLDVCSVSRIAGLRHVDVPFSLSRRPRVMPFHLLCQAVTVVALNASLQHVTCPQHPVGCRCSGGRMGV